MNDQSNSTGSAVMKVGGGPTVASPPDVTTTTRQGITSEQHQMLLQYFASDMKSPYPWWEAACRIAWATGLLLSDIVGLSWPDIDFPNRTITLVPRKLSKLYKNVSIPMDVDLYDYLTHLREHPFRNWHRHSKYLLPELRGLYQSPSRPMTISQFRLICAQAGVPDEITFKCYKQAFIARLMGSADALSTMSEMTGLRPETVVKRWLNTPPKTYAACVPLAASTSSSRVVKNVPP